MTLGQGNDTSLGHGQQLCEILSRFIMTAKSYDLDTNFGYVCIVTLEISPWIKVMTHPWVMDNKCVKYYPDPTWKWGIMARTQFLVCVHCDLDLTDMSSGQGHDIPATRDHNSSLKKIMFPLLIDKYKYSHKYSHTNMHSNDHIHLIICALSQTRHVFVKHGCPRRQQSHNMAKIS